MKKIIILASALVLGGTAYAQDASMQPPASGSTMPATPDASQPAAGGGATTPDASMPAASAPDASAPAATTPDASGGAMSGGAAGQTGAATDDSSLPVCSKTVTDKCRQGGGSGTAHHRATHHRK